MTFFLQVDDGARLEVNKVSLIDCWSRSPTPARGQCIAGASMRVTAGYLYSLRLDYRHVEAGASAKLLWTSASVQPKQVIAPENLFFVSDTASHALSIGPGPPSVGQSSGQGHMLTLGTAGVQSSFLILARDSFGNACDSAQYKEGDQGVSVPVEWTGVQFAIMTQAQTVHGKAGAIDDHGKYLGMISPVVASRQDQAQPPGSNACHDLPSLLSVFLLERGGMAATYYAGNGQQEALSATASTVKTSKFPTSLITPFRVFPPLSRAMEEEALRRYNNTYVLRWSGFLHLDPGIYTFSTRVQAASPLFPAASASPAAGGRGVRLWLDGALVIDQLNQSSGLVGVTDISHRDTPLPLLVEVHDRYEAGEVMSIANLSLFLDSAQGPHNSATLIATYRLLSGEQIGGSPYKMRVEPAPVCAAQSSLSTQHHVPSALFLLSLVTAGRAAQFFVTARDAYGNRMSLPAPWPFPSPLALSASGGVAGSGESREATMGLGVAIFGGAALAYVSPLAVEGVRDEGQLPPPPEADACAATSSTAGVFKVRYTLTRSGTYDIRVSFGGSLVKGSPFRISALAGRRHLPSCHASGAGLTLTTAGLVSWLTLTVRDQHMNVRPDARISEAGLRVFVQDQDQPQRLIPMGSVTPPPPFLPADPSFYEPSGGMASAPVPANPNKATLSLNYMLTRSGHYLMRIAGRGLHEGQVPSAPFALHVAPHSLCACASSVTVPAALSVATAGVSVSLSILSRDEVCTRVAALALLTLALLTLHVLRGSRAAPKCVKEVFI